MHFFLKAKHWQLFILLIGAMVAPSFFILSSPLLYQAGTVVFMFLYFGWLCSVGVACNKIAPANLKKSPRIMLMGLLYALIYAVVFSAFMASTANEPPRTKMWFILPFHVAAMGCIFYCIIYAAQRLVSVQRGQNVGFFEYSGPFFMFWFFPLGIWFLQPNVNNLVGAKNA